MTFDFLVRCVLMDVEGTTSSISFVHETMFPFARARLEKYLARHWLEPAVRECLAQIAVDAQGSLDAVLDLPDGEARSLVVGHLNSLMDRDAKATGLKRLQGMIWEDGFRSGQLVAHLYSDVTPCLKRWHAAGIDLRIYSSGSVQAQRLFYGHTEAGNLLPLLSGHYDTTTGPKREAGSYRAIAADAGVLPGEILFLSDIPAELDAAAEAGLRVCLLERPGNAPVGQVQHPRVATFDQLSISRC